MGKKTASLTSKHLRAVHERVMGSDLPDDDKQALDEILENSIKLKELVENSRETVGGKAVIASLPFGFDLVK